MRSSTAAPRTSCTGAPARERLRARPCEDAPPAGAGRGGVRLAAVAGLLGMLLGGCTLFNPRWDSSPLAPVPAPLLETLDWQLASSQGAFLGVKGEENDSGSLDQLFFDPGVRVVRVVENSPAARAGLAPADVVLSVDGEAVDDPGALDARVAARAAGETAVLSVRRGDTVFDVEVPLAAAAGGPAAAPQPRYRLDPARSRAGWAAGQGGAVLVSADPGSPFPRAGVPVGSVVLAVDGEPVASDRALIRRLQTREPGADVRVLARLPGADAAREIEVRLQEQPTVLTGVEIPLLWRYDATPDGERCHVDLLDWWFFQLYAYDRKDGERHHVLIELFGWDVLEWSTGVGELAR
jgi:membrane-associated protease RseP (regulator of RpoE activity)